MSVIAVVLMMMQPFCANAAETRRIPTHITYRVEEGVYVDAGTEQGLQKGIRGQLIIDDGGTYVFEVLQSAGSSALLRLDGHGEWLVGKLEIQPADLVFEPVDSVDDAVGQERQKERGATVGQAEPFVPLLAPQQRLAEVSQSASISHGNLGFSLSMQTGTESGQDRMMTRVYSSGNIDRLFGSGWSLNWSGNARYRSGDGYRDHAEYETMQPLVYSAMLQHPLAGTGFVRLGRFLPYELPGVGYLDGAQLEIDAGRACQLGVMGGLKPDRINLDASPDEPTVVGYVTLEAGTRGAAYYSGTGGILASQYKGEANRLALLLDQRIALGSRFDLLSTAEYDFGIADTTNSATQLSRLDLTASYRIFHDHALRAGASHWERADTPVERDRLEIVDEALFDDGYWRYWIGARHRLPWKLRLNEEVAYTVSDASEDAVRWRAGLTRTDLFGWSSANIQATVYNLEAMDSSGMGWLLSSYLPFVEGRYALRPVASMRWLDPDGGGDGFSVSYYALYLDARLAEAWLLTGGVTQTLGDGADSLMIDAGLRYSW